MLRGNQPDGYHHLLRNIIGKAAYIFLIRIIPLQCHFNTYSIFSLSGEMENFIQVILPSLIYLTNSDRPPS